MDDKFHLWVRFEAGDALTPYRSYRAFDEPAEAADVAEYALSRIGEPGVSYMELRYNGDTTPHTTIFFMDRTEDNEPVFGYLNAEDAKWPIFLPPEFSHGRSDLNLKSPPENFNMPDPESGFGDEDEDSHLMNLGHDDEDEDEMEDENEGDESEDEWEEDEWEDDEDDSEEDSDSSGDEEDGDSESDSEDEGDGEDSDDESEQDDEAEDENDGEDESEMPRLKIFAKMRGPKGWRKRAEAEELLDRNVFALKVGVLDEDGATPAKQEQNVRAHVEFVETDEMRSAGILRIKLPEGITLDDFTQLKSGWINVAVPYTDTESEE